MDSHSNQSTSTEQATTTPTRRRFLAGMLATVSTALLPPFAHGKARVHSGWLHLQDCRIAGSQYYECHEILARLHRGNRLRLRRQPSNPHDDRAIEVFWRRHKLGYLPRLDNAAAASLLDRAHALRAEIIAIDDPEDAWEPVQLRVWAKT